MKVVDLVKESISQDLDSKSYKTILADPPWRFQNRTGKMAPEHQRLMRYPTMTLDEICNLPIEKISDEDAHLYLWIPNALLSWGLEGVIVKSGV